MSKYFIITFGCQMNRSDSERIARVLEKIGYKNTSKMDEADLMVINMCSVRQSAVDRVYGLRPKFEKLKIQNSKFKTILTGCILKKDRKKFASCFDYILDIRTLPRFARQNLDSLRYKYKNLELKDLPNWPRYFSIIPHDRSKLWKNFGYNNYLKIQPRHFSFPTGFVPISSGCNNFCSYCVVPYTRGPEICRSTKEIIDEVKGLIKQDFKEIWLLGQNVNSFLSGNIDFPKLLKMINDIQGDFWIRFTSSHPKDFSDELIEAMTECKKVTPYLNLPVQSGDDEILKKMNRKYKIEDYKEIVRKIRKKIPDITLSTDIIVGFPEETKKQFENTVKLFKKIKYDMAYIAQYSSRPGTTAAKLKDNVLQEEKKRRERVLTEILKKTALAKNKKYLGKTMEILPIEYKDGFLIGKSFHYKTVKFEGLKDSIDKFVKVKITDATPFGLKGICQN